MASVASTALEGVRPMETIVSPEGETLAYFIPNYIPDKLQFLSPGQEVRSDGVRLALCLSLPVSFSFSFSLPRDFSNDPPNH